MSLFFPTNLPYSLIKQDVALGCTALDPRLASMMRRDEHGRPSKQTDEGPSQKSLVRLLPANAICPMVGLRQGRRGTDSSVPKRSKHGLSRFPALLPELPSPEEQGMCLFITRQCADEAALVESAKSLGTRLRKLGLPCRRSPVPRIHVSVAFLGVTKAPPLILLAVSKVARSGERVARRTSPPAGRTETVRSSRSSRLCRPNH
jgi:hypothetical protein